MEDSSNLFVFHPKLTVADRVVLENLQRDVLTHEREVEGRHDSPLEEVIDDDEFGGKGTVDRELVDKQTLKARNDPASSDFVPTIVVHEDVETLAIPKFFNNYLLRPYTAWARSIVRVETDVVFITHLLLYFTTSVPSAIYLFYSFNRIHGIIHTIMNLYYMGTYTLMMHQHIHQRGILAKRFWLFDTIFPYITDPLMGHTWNSYFYHHVKHHHVEGNGPDDLSSTMRFQRDSVWDFAAYVGRFYFAVWAELPRYFVSKKKYGNAVRAAFFEFSSYAYFWATAYYISGSAALHVFIIPFLLARVGLMVGNWGQHAFVDEVDPTSDFRSSITLVDVASNRYCFNDGYHTSHHLNPLRHWRDHPVAFLADKSRYAAEGALTFHDIDYIMITVRLLRKDYAHLARRLVPMGPEQLAMSLEERADMLRRKTRRFTEAEIEALYGKGGEAKKVL